MNLISDPISLRTQSQELTLTQRAEAACSLATQFEKVGEFEAAREALREFWPQNGEIPNLAGLDDSTKAEMLLRCGALSRCLSSSNQTQGGQEIAKNLITQAIDVFEKSGKSVRLAEAHGELALSYWCEGSFDEARIHLDDAINGLGTGNSELRAILLIRRGIVAMCCRHPNEALHLFEEAAPLLEGSHDHALKGTFHNEFGLVLKTLAVPENREEYLDRALIEYAAASFHFEQAGNKRYQASVENNLGFLFLNLAQFSEAHKHLNRAADLFLHLDDLVHLAQVNETRGRVLLAEGKTKDAERIVQAAVKTLEKGDEQALLAEALATHGTIVARLGNHSRARKLLERAIEIAETCGDLEAAGRARLSIIEELSDQTSATELASILHDAADLLQKSQDPSAAKRLTSSALRTVDALLVELEKQISLPESESWENFSIKREIRKIEARFIERALRDAGGSVTRASHMLGFNHHQSLIALLSTRHKKLQNHRSIRRKRRRPIVNQAKRKEIQETSSGRPAAKLSILHVEDHKAIAQLIQESLAAEGMEVHLCENGAAACEVLKSKTPYDALIVDNNLPGLSGLELVLRVRTMPHRRNLPIVMLSSDDCEKEAWRAGADAFLRKPEGADQLSSTLLRVIEKRSKD